MMLTLMHYILYLTIFHCILINGQRDVLEDDISMAGGDRNSEPTIVLNPGDPGPLDVNFGELLYSRCSVIDSNQYSYRWIQRAPDGTIKEISSDARLYITNFGPEHLQYPLRCEVTRLSDDETFEKVLNLRLASSGELSTDDEYKTLNLTIKPLPNEDFRQGTIMRQCLFENDPEINELFDFRWIDQNGRIVTNGDTLYLLVGYLLYFSFFFFITLYVYFIKTNKKSFFFFSVYFH
ncbi:hypothetical protein MS3_00004035 [Schistosoma haematobium]|uniref:Ig-like domain-containing protein n=1 Tax=Schistosoma haematobium TaxID=6185 RepID=A0A922LRM8_SCHHA|nr:hypothetical protein MS3_00004035 [Schistosoma haematobium]KAH9591939.1 hypothetical protein MS3_00004035 [Schistosoma haematobium]